LILLAGCADVPADAGFSDVQRIASERLDGRLLRWDQGAPEDGKGAEFVAQLLESPLTADNAVQIALFNNRHLQAAYEELGISRADLVQAGLVENPSFSAEVLIGNAGSGPVNPSLSLVQDFLNILTRSARRSVASSELERTRYEVTQKVLDLAAEVRTAYYSAVADEQAAGLFRQVVSATEAAAELSQRQAHAGNVNRRDQALQQAQYAQAVVELARVEARIANDREALNRLLGLWGDQVSWNLPDRLPELPSTKPPLEGLETLAITRRLDLAGARQDVQTATYALELGEQLRWLSVFGLGLRLERDPDSGKWLKGPIIELTLPIFDQGQGRIARLESARRRSEKAFVGLAIDVRSEVRESWARLAAAQDAATFYKSTILPLQQRIVEENTRLANGMLISIYDVLRGRQDQINAARDYIGAIKDYWIALASLEKALAGPLPEAPRSSAISPERRVELTGGDGP
jgi:cobalt-zinc-cadmium efflux system outer membrane protein